MFKHEFHQSLSIYFYQRSRRLISAENPHNKVAITMKKRATPKHFNALVEKRLVEDVFKTQNKQLQDHSSEEVQFNTERWKPFEGTTDETVPLTTLDSPESVHTSIPIRKIVIQRPNIPQSLLLPQVEHHTSSKPPGTPLRTPQSFIKPSIAQVVVVQPPSLLPAPTVLIPTTSGATTLLTCCNTVDVEQLSPQNIWLKLCNNHKDINYCLEIQDYCLAAHDYCLAIQKLIDLNFNPFPNNPRPDSLFMTCLDFISENSYLIEDNLPPFIYLNLDYFEQLKMSCQDQIYKHFK